LGGDSRAPKFAWGEAVSNHPDWRWQAAGGVAFAVLIFAAAYRASRGAARAPSAWLAVTANALAGGIVIGWAVENVGLESLGIGAWIRSLALVAVAIVSPIVASAAIMRMKPMPPLSAVLSIQDLRKSDKLAAALGLVLAATLILSLQVILGLVFDPRYKDFPFAPLTAAIVPLVVHGFTIGRSGDGRGAAETAGAVLLAASVAYTVPNETLANWQSLWLCAALAALAVTLIRTRAARG
jgi:glucan 1,3-beta-glucosidase